jgi:hypothetical protein
MNFMHRRALLFIFGIPLVLGICGSAYAYFTSQGVGAGASTTGSLAKPVIGTATPGAGTVTLTWGAVPPPATGAVTYFVTANGGTPPGGTCGTSGSPIAATTCTVTGLSAGSNSFTVTAAWQSFTSTSTPATPVTLTSGAAAKLVFTTQPVGNVGEATNFTTSPKVSVEDSSGNVATSDTGTVTVATATGPGGTLTCSNTGFPTIAAVAGVATFTNCQISGPAAAGTYTLQATRGGLTTALSGNVVINPGTATKLALSTQPTLGQNIQAKGTGTFLASVTVQDANANTVTTATNTITLAIGINPSAGVLACTNTGGLTVTAVSGVANFTGCSITKTGNGYTLAATSSPVLTPPVNANSFNITAGVASKLVFTTQPVGGVIVGTNFATQPKASVEDANSNVVTSDIGSVTLSIATYVAGNGGSTQGTLACTTNPVNAVAGVATFAGCKINGTAAAGTYTLSAVRAGLTSATSSGVVITAGVASKLVFTTQPVGGVLPATNFGTQPKVSVEDAAGDVVTTDTGTVTLSIASYTAGNGGTTQGTLVCTTNPVNAVAGVATFAGCQITGSTSAGTYTLSAARSGLASGTSSNVVIT